MKQSNFLFGIACIASLSACTEQDLVKPSSDGTVEIVASMDAVSQTRTCVSENIGTEKTDILWMPQDKIGVYGTGNTKNAVFVNTNIVNVPEATFRGNLPDNESPFYAYYPYSTDNNSQSYTEVKGNLSLQQSFDTTDGRLECDYKVGVPKIKNGRSFSFTHLFSLLRFRINATGTALEGDRLESITITLPESRRLGGEFTADLSTRNITWTSSPTGCNQIVMEWTDRPDLSNGKTYMGYITCAPDVKQGDNVLITICTQKFIATFTRQLRTDFKANCCYTFPLELINYNNDMVISTRPGFNSFSFDVSNNKGKILDKEVYYNGAVTTVKDITTQALTIEGNTISGCIPYLYDFNLTPTFEVPEGITVSVNGTTQESGKHTHNFSNPVEYVVSNGKDSRTFKVSVTNTGLPVVVIKQNSTGSTLWKEAGINIQPKESTWTENEDITVYKADGTPDLSTAKCGMRLRGNSTQGFPKKPFAIKLKDKANLLGIMPDGKTHKRWCLLANWIDRSLLRNTVAFEIAHQTENAWKSGAIEQGLIWNPSGRNVELVIDGRHVGNYFLCEQIKVDKNRLNIKDAYEDIRKDGNTNPTTADCGYLIEFDDGQDEPYKFLSSRRLPYQLKDGDDDPLPTNFQNYVKNKVQGIEDNLDNAQYSTAYNDLDINSVIDYWIVYELTMNDEYKHPKSVYMYINGDGKLSAGPVWDFDYQTFPNKTGIDAINAAHGMNSSYNYTHTLDEWMYSKVKVDPIKYPLVDKKVSTEDKPYMWYPLLFKDENFRKRVQERWAVIKPLLDSITEKIITEGEKNKVSEKYNFAMWPIESAQRNSTTGVDWYVEFSGDERLENYDAVLQNLKDIYSKRLMNMNANITAGSFYTNGK